MILNPEWRYKMKFDIKVDFTQIATQIADAAAQMLKEGTEARTVIDATAKTIEERVDAAASQIEGTVAVVLPVAVAALDAAVTRAEVRADRIIGTGLTIANVGLDIAKGVKAIVERELTGDTTAPAAAPVVAEAAPAVKRKTAKKAVRKPARSN